MYIFHAHTQQSLCQFWKGGCQVETCLYKTEKSFLQLYAWSLAGFRDKGREKQEMEEGGVFSFTSLFTYSFPFFFSCHLPLGWAQRRVWRGEASVFQRQIVPFKITAGHN